ncbi:MAG: transporter substrate-binding domain-containing protein [Pseudomonas sp.]|uniref:substrate-binding periplasmic protein n=1 Tax=Pseudomonas sp. TaxID=306 RepID=UPI002733817A|nr:transporter substrate-binding domain-containing protein [Pseudomonas sp.]MDP3845494.1 transporter substrate-binding domain-containing protein [Pseudomonas sp.]
MCRHFVYACLCALLLNAATLAAPLQMVANNFPPFTDQTLPYNGLAVDLVSTALSRAGFASEYQEVPWARAIEGLQHDRYDLTVATWFAPERAVYGQFSDPYFTNTIRFIRKKGSHVEFKQLSDLRPYLISVVRGYAYAPAFDSDASLKKHPVTSFASAARMLALGRVQLTLEDETVAQHAFNGELRDIRDELEFLPKPLSESPLHILVRRSHPQHQQIIDGFNQAIRAMQADGTYQTILKRHAND